MLSVARSEVMRTGCQSMLVPCLLSAARVEVLKDSVMFDVRQLRGVVSGKDGGDKDFMILNS